MADAPLGLSLERVMQQFRALVLSVGRRAGLVDADLDELVQAVRLRLWRARGDDDIEDGDVTASYMHQAARSAAIDIVRARRGRMASASESVEPLPLVDGAVLPDVAIERREVAARIQAAIDALPTDRRTAVKLHLAGYGRREIGEMLGWSDDRVRNLTHRGMTDLRARLVALGLAPSGEA